MQHKSFKSQIKPNIQMMKCQTKGKHGHQLFV
jgi:hypothetical protein